MTKASDNVFPRFLVSEGGSTATPAAGNVTIYAKADGLLYQKDDAGAETLLASGASGAVATDAIWDAAGDTVVGSGANTAVKRKNNDGTTVAPTVNDDSGDGYAIGSRWLDTTNDVEYVCLDATVAAAVWRTTTHAVKTNDLDAAQTIGSANTATDITGCSVDLEPGTWAIFGNAMFARGSTDSIVTFAITTAANSSVASTRSQVATAASWMSLSCHAVVTIAAATTYKLRAVFVSGTTGIIKPHDENIGGLGTRITAIRVA